MEDDDQKQVMKSIQETLEAIKVNLAESWKSRCIIPTSRAKVWCSKCGDSGHFASKCYKGPQKQVHFVDLEIGVYYTISDEEEEAEVNPIFQVQPIYGRDKGITQLIRAGSGPRPRQIGSSQVLIPQARYLVGIC